MSGEDTVCPKPSSYLTNTESPKICTTPVTDNWETFVTVQLTALLSLTVYVCGGRGELNKIPQT